MPTDSRPVGVKTAGMSKVIFVASIADPTAPTVAEITAGIPIECYIMPGQFPISVTDNIDTDSRYCDDQTFGTIGQSAWTFGPAVYIWDPQGDGTEAGNKAYGTLTRGTNGYICQRDGVDISTAIAADDILTFVAPVECGTQAPTPLPDTSTGGGGQVSKFTITQAFATRGEVEQFVSVVTGT